MVEIHRSASKHGVVDVDADADADARQSASDYLVAYLIDGDSPGRELRLGFDTTGRLLETVVLILNDAEVGIHAMKARGSYFDLLPPGREGQP